MLILRPFGKVSLDLESWVLSVENWTRRRCLNKNWILGVEKAVDAAIGGHQGIRQVFCSRQKGGLPYFGRQVPALLVFEKDQVIPTEVFPHRKSGGQDFSIESWIQGRLGRK